MRLKRQGSERQASPLAEWPADLSVVHHIRFVLRDFHFWHESDFHYFPPLRSALTAVAAASFKWETIGQAIIGLLYGHIAGGAVAEAMESARPLGTGDRRRETFRSRYP